MPPRSCPRVTAYPPRSSESDMQQRVSLITLGVADLERARAFYEAMGWVSHTGPEEGVVFFQTGGSVLALWGRNDLAEDSVIEDSGGFGGIVLAYNAGSPAEVDAVIEEARPARAHIPRRPRGTFWGGGPRRLPPPGRPR